MEQRRWLLTSSEVVVFGARKRKERGTGNKKGEKRKKMQRQRRSHWPTDNSKDRSKARDVDGFKLWYSESERRQNGVSILVNKDLRGQVVEVRRVSDRLMTIKIVVGGFTLHVCSVYALQTGLDEEVKASFWEALDEVVRSVPSLENIFIAGDFNRHIGVLLGGYDDVHGGFGFGDRNGKGAALLDFTRAFGLVVVNSSFSKKEDHLITF
ncbi:craniofacial development protein 2-like [Capsicum annuum]|uniref:craniofacial development protein 2-like n=1 Tax=Capsicum annuum TaxID=4072 RepID=UPI001FB05987|nr:craniofacial development protein 2-like [Capsicum annuum]